MARLTLAGAANVDFAACATRADSGLRADSGVEPRVELVPPAGGGTASRGIDGPEFLAKDVCGVQGPASGSWPRRSSSRASASVLVNPIGCCEGVPLAMAATAASAVGLAAISTASPELRLPDEGLAMYYFWWTC